MTTDELAAPTIFHGRILDTPEDPFDGGELRAEECALVVSDGVITFRGSLAKAQQQNPSAPVTGVDGVLLPGLVDTHVHYPQLRIIGGLGMPLLEWLERCALPEEARMADLAYAEVVAGEFVGGLISAGTTTALSFGAHYAPATDALFRAAHETGMRMTAGLVVADQELREDLLTTPERAASEAAGLIETWHGKGKLRYAVTPRFALSASANLLDSCRDTLTSSPDLFFTSHVNENKAEMAAVAGLFPTSSNYSDVYDQHGLLGPRSLLAHNVHPTDVELARLSETGTAVSHCPSSNSALGSGLFPLRRHLQAGVRVSLGSDVGAGTGFSQFKEGLQAYFHQQLQPDGVPLTPAHLLHLATRSGARALGYADVGHLSVGAVFDAIEVHPPSGSPLNAILRHAESAERALAAVFANGTSADINRVWMSGVLAHSRAQK
ncbi:guanine deaminase [Arthrobacter roseus]|uniref:guanine deaminase n=1 Tax=Arthrobacter roseus TaxID=136274 RepID=UPI0019638362|nr:guanine deaminase [Arthrobacter roseus]MBM7847566.1 guanine deaminase [Arthrobacter roseus]